MSSDIEIEIKIKLTKEKFNEMKRYFEDNGKFIKNVEQKDEYFINKKILNYKHFYPEKEEVHTYCDEYEVNIDNTDKLNKIFQELNIYSFALIHKFRSIYMYKNDKYEVSLDEVENLGYFIEIEVKKIESSYEEERKLLDLEAENINLNLDDIDQRGYPFHFIKN